MSYELDYFPPAGTSWKWNSKPLNYSPWSCNLANQMDSKHYLHPMSIDLSVDLIDSKYHWFVRITDFSATKSEFKGICKDPLMACLKAELVGEEHFKKMMPEWVITALDNGWRPPFKIRTLYG